MLNEGGQQRILVVDDESHIRVVLSDFLTARGFQVREAGNGDLALEKCSYLEARCGNHRSLHATYGGNLPLPRNPQILFRSHHRAFGP